MWVWKCCTCEQGTANTSVNPRHTSPVGILDILCPRRPLQEHASCQPLEPPSSPPQPDGYSHRWVFPSLQHESPWPHLDSLGRLKHNERTWTIPRMLLYILSSVLQEGDTSSWQNAGSLLTCSSVFSNAASAAPEFLRANKIFTVTPAIHHSHPFGGGTRRASWHPGQGHSRWLTWGTHGRRNLFPRAFCCQSSPDLSSTPWKCRLKLAGAGRCSLNFPALLCAPVKCFHRAFASPFNVFGTTSNWSCWLE